MNNPFRSGALWFALLTLNLLAIPVSAQVPQDMTYTGRLVDNLGFPLASPATLELRVFDAATVGTQLYSEQHLGVVAGRDRWPLGAVGPGHERGGPTSRSRLRREGRRRRG